MIRAKSLRFRLCQPLNKWMIQAGRTCRTRGPRRIKPQQPCAHRVGIAVDTLSRCTPAAVAGSRADHREHRNERNAGRRTDAASPLVRSLHWRRSCRFRHDLGRCARMRDCPAECHVFDRRLRIGLRRSPDPYEFAEAQGLLRERYRSTSPNQNSRDSIM
jgi:hypothetical protein